MRSHARLFTDQTYDEYNIRDGIDQTWIVTFICSYYTYVTFLCMVYCYKAVFVETDVIINAY